MARETDASRRELLYRAATFLGNDGIGALAQRIYLDHAATTPVFAAARSEWLRGLDAWANPSSPHAEGRAARALLEEARQRVATALGWDHDVIFTSGASEAIVMAASRASVAKRARGATEHAIVGHAMGVGATPLPVRGDGLVDEQALDEVLEAGPALIALQMANNETGIVQPLSGLAPRIRAAGSLLLADCAQSAGKLPLPDADFIAISAHKLGGPAGIGALLVRDLSLLEAVGGQERGYRRGTQDMPAALAFAAALEAKAYDLQRLQALRDHLEDGVRAAGGVVIGEGSPRIATIGTVALAGASSASLVVQFDLAGIAVSAGSACSSGKMKGSEVLGAMGVAAEYAAGAIRVSFGAATTMADVDAFLIEWRRIAARSSKAA